MGDTRLTSQHHVAFMLGGAQLLDLDMLFAKPGVLCGVSCCVFEAAWWVQDALVWNAMYIVRGRKAIFGAVNLWCYFNHIDVKINRIGVACLFNLTALTPCW